MEDGNGIAINEKRVSWVSTHPTMFTTIFVRWDGIKCSDSIEQPLIAHCALKKEQKKENLNADKIKCNINIEHRNKIKQKKNNPILW